MSFSILTLNLHSYQESRAGASVTERLHEHGPLFDRIATAVIELDITAICLQEVAEWREEPETRPYGQTASNAAYRIQQRLGAGYHMVQDWSHYAWNRWREGAAILSKWPIVKSESRYVTGTQAKSWWKSRNILMAQIDIPTVGRVNLFSVHTGWWEDTDEPFQRQFDALAAWADKEDDERVAATLLCGDFNIQAGSLAYKYVLTDGRYSDQYLQANPGGMYDATIGAPIDGWDQGQSGGHRIDYIFMKQGSKLTVQEAGIIFTESSYGRVSDHAGVYACFTGSSRPGR